MEDNAIFKILILYNVIKVKNDVLNNLDIYKTISHLICDALNMPYTRWFSVLKNKNQKPLKVGIKNRYGKHTDVTKK